MTPVIKTLVNHAFNFAPDFGKTSDVNRAWLFATISVDRDMDYLMGCGADWWFDCYLNGKKVDGTFPQGNVQHPPMYTDHQFTLKLKKGENVIAVKFRSGDASSVISMGGAKDLQNVEFSPEIQARREFYRQRGVALEVENVVPKDLNDKIQKGLAPKEYAVIDSNWLKLLKPKTGL